MTVKAVGLRLHCDEPGCGAFINAGTEAGLRHLADQYGWALNRPGAKDFCNLHHPPRFPDTPVPSPAQRRALERLEAMGPGAWSGDIAPYPVLAVLHREHWITGTDGFITRRGRWIIGRPDVRDRDNWNRTHSNDPQPEGRPDVS